MDEVSQTPEHTPDNIHSPVVSPITPKNIFIFVASLLLALSLPVTMWVSNQNTYKQSRANTAPLGSVRINPEIIVTDINQPTIHLSALAYDTNGMPMTTGVTYQWGVSTTNSIGTLDRNSNDALAAFTPSKTNRGRGDIYVTAFWSELNTTRSIPVYVGVDPDHTISVSVPNGGESYSPNQTIPIRWTSSGVSTVAIDMIDADGKFSTIALPMNAGLEVFNWTIPNSWYGTSTQFKIKVYEYPVTGVADTSDTSFTISYTTSSPTPTRTPTPTPTPRPPTPTPAQTLRITTPNTSEQLVIGSSYQIQWTSINVSTLTAIRLLYYDNVDTYLGMHTLGLNVPNTLIFPWTVSDYGASQGRATKYKIRIESQWTSDVSDAYFTIASPTPTNTPTPTPTVTPTKIPTPTSGITPTSAPLPTIKPTATPPKPNNRPTFTTRVLPVAKLRKPYLGYIAAQDVDRDTMTMTITGLPTGLSQGICKSGVSPTRPSASTLTCTITGSSLRTGIGLVTATIRDARGGTTRQLFPLITLPW